MGFRSGSRVVLIALLWLLMAGCGPLPFPAVHSQRPAADPYQSYRPSMQPWMQARLEEIGTLPRYRLRVELDGAGDRLSGDTHVSVPNTSRDTWPDLVFHLYPNTPHYQGTIAVSQVVLDGQAVVTEMIEDGTGLRVVLPAHLPPGQEVEVAMRFNVTLPRGSDGYTLFGWEDDILSLPGFYPALAVYEEASIGETGRWLAQVPPLFADVLFNSAAWYELEFTAPAALTVVASGTTLLMTDNQDGARTWHIVGGPLRDMTVMASDRWHSVSHTAAGATVTSYYPADEPSAGQAALFHAAAALRLYSDLWGCYPYTEFDVVAAPLGSRGMEYSGLVTVGEDIYSRHRQQLAFLVAHETAHQWWYVQVGNDPLAHPWLDEGLAEYAAFDYYRGVYGQGAAEALLSTRWLMPMEALSAKGAAEPVDRPAEAVNATEYELLAYGRASLFFNALRERLGDELYLEVLRTYVETYRWQVATPQRFLRLAQNVSGVNLNPLAESWLR